MQKLTPPRDANRAACLREALEAIDSTLLLVDSTDASDLRYLQDYLHAADSCDASESLLEIASRIDACAAGLDVSQNFELLDAAQGFKKLAATYARDARYDIVCEAACLDDAQAALLNEVAERLDISSDELLIDAACIDAEVQAALRKQDACDAGSEAHLQAAARTRGLQADYALASELAQLMQALAQYLDALHRSSRPCLADLSAAEDKTIALLDIFAGEDAFAYCRVATASSILLRKRDIYIARDAVQSISNAICEAAGQAAAHPQVHLQVLAIAVAQARACLNTSPSEVGRKFLAHRAQAAEYAYECFKAACE